MANKLTEEEKKAIAEYEENITTLGSFVEAVRMKPGMYLGELGDKGWFSSIREILDNAFDQMLVKGSPCDLATLHVDTISKEVIVTDNGLGLPINSMVRILTEQHTSKNYDHGKGEYSSGSHGVGAKVVNALSEWFIAESYFYDGSAARLELYRGIPVTKEPEIIPNPDKKQGTKIRFKIDEEILGKASPDKKVHLDFNYLTWFCRHKIYGMPIGSKMILTVLMEDGQLYEETIENTEGVIMALKNNTSNTIIDPICISNDCGTMKIDIAFTYDSKDMEIGLVDPTIVSFSNLCPTVDGTHVKGFTDGLSSWLVKYMNNVYLVDKRTKIKIINRDVFCGLHSVIYAAHIEPNFTGQQKQFIDNPDFVPFIKDSVINTLDQWAKDKPNDLVKLCKYIKDIADIRVRSEKEKVKIATKYTKNVLTGYPHKYAKPSGNKNLELIITEGDSAAGSAKSGRDVNTQGVFPIRGKLPNAFTTSKEKFLSNEEIQGILAIIWDRKPYSRNLDPIKDCKFDKIIIMADADIDGGHIASLFLNFMIVYCPQLIEAGKIYKAVPPLYGISKGTKKGKDGKNHIQYQYFTEMSDVTKYVQKDFVKKNQVTLFGNPLKGTKLTDFLVRNIDYVYEIENIASRNYIDPNLLELYLINKLENKTLDELKSVLDTIWRFNTIEHNSTYNMDIISIINNGKQTLYGNDQLMNECSEIIRLLSLDNITSLSLTLNGMPCTLYSVMRAYEDSSPDKLQRFKGLGEMDASDLAESTLLPTSDRTLIQYSVGEGGVKQLFEEIRSYNIDKKKILEQITTVNRKDLQGL